MNKSFIVPLIAVLMTTTSVNPAKAATREPEASASTVTYPIALTNTDISNPVSAQPLELAKVTVGQALAKETIAPTPQTLQETAKDLVDQKFGTGYFAAFSALVTAESTWNPTAVNRYSGAYGLGQALPAAKMAPYGADYKTNPTTQIKWMIDYIADRYGNPANALAFHRVHNYY